MPPITHYFCSRLGCRKTSCPYHQEHLSEVEPPAFVDIRHMERTEECAYKKEKGQ